MIVVEDKTIDGKQFTYTYSDKGFYIVNEVGYKFADAYDLIEYPHTYTETDDPIPQLSAE